MSINGAAGEATAAGEAVLWFRMRRAHSNETRRTAAHARKSRPHSRPPPRPAAARLRALVRGASAAHLARRCVGELDATLAAATDFAEGLALRAACLATEADTAHAGHAARGARRDIGRALRLAARNPRVLLIDAMSDYQLAPERGGDKERALAKLRQAVAAFELERAGTEQLPGWGAAEAYLLLARDLLDHGEPVAARDALEHALLLAPEFAQARRDRKSTRLNSSHLVISYAV